MCAGTAPRSVAITAAPGSHAAARVALLVLGTALALWPTWASLERFWRQIHDYQHGYLVVALVAAWFVVEWRRLDALPVRPAPLALPLLAAGLFAWLVAWKAHSEILTQLLWPAIALAAVWSGLGWQAARSVLLPIGFLYFAVPIWDYLVPLLQWLTVEASRHLLALVQIPIEVDGNFITIPDGTFEVAEGCAGKRYFVVTLATAMAAGMLQRLPGRRLALLVTLAAAMALLMNWIRVLVIIVAGHVTAMQHHLVAVEHLTFGWILFGVLVLGVVFLAHRLGRTTSPAATLSPHVAAQPATAAVAWAFPLVLLAVAAAVQWRGESPAAEAPPLQPYPLLTGAWQGPLPAAAAWQPAFPGASSEMRAAYLGRDRRVEIYANVYGMQQPGRELIGFGNSLAGHGWTLKGDRHAGDSSAAQYLSVTAPDGTRWVVGRVYRIGGRTVGWDVLAQVWYGFQALAGPVPAGVIAFATPCKDNCDAAQGSLEAFWAQAAEALLDIVPGRHNGDPAFE